jgi:ankyrin repeat protein
VTTPNSRALPRNANAEHLRKEAKALSRKSAGMKLTDAQFQLARSYGFASWPKMMAHVAAASANNRIYSAILEGDVEEVRELLDDNPSLVFVRHHHDDEDPRDFEMTPLQFAARHGQLAICKLLVDRDAEVYTHPHATYPPVMEAAWGGHQDVVDYFLKEIPHKAAGTNGIGLAINLAGRQGWYDVVKKHIERDPLSVYQRGWIGDTPLHWPSHNNFANIVELLLDAGADIEAEENNWIGGTPLHWASEHAPDCVRLLLDRGAKVDSRNTRAGSKFLGVTPLIMNATQRNDASEVAEMLLAAGADINAVDASGKTALHHATDLGLSRIPKVLRAHGAIK